MTKKEALQSLFGDLEVKSATTDKVLIDAGITGDETYSSNDKQEIDLCFAEVLLTVANSPDYTEGNLSVKIDRGQLLSLRDSILRKYDKNQGTISGDPVW